MLREHTYTSTNHHIHGRNAKGKRPKMFSNCGKEHDYVINSNQLLFKLFLCDTANKKKSNSSKSEKKALLGANQMV